MPSSGLNGPYPLIATIIDRTVAANRIGAYVLGHISGGNVFNITYVGRSDDDLAGRLKQHVGSYTQFKFGYFSSAVAAFEKECTLYHDFEPRHNEIHPARPRTGNHRCPRCGQ